MGCCGSSNSPVQPLEPEEVRKGDQDETGSKVDGRGDSAVSKGTTDSGVVMESRDIPVLPGEVPRKLPPLIGVRESDADRNTQDTLLEQQGHPKSSKILEELLIEGIIPVGQTSERGSRAGEAYSIMLDDRESVGRRRPPARLQSLKARRPTTIEEFEDKLRLAEERRKLREDDFKMRLRAKSARVRGPAPTCITEDGEDAAVTLVEPLQSAVSPDPIEPLPHSHIRREAAEGEERVREAAGDDREETGRADKRAGSRERGGERADNRGDGAERRSVVGEEEEEEMTQLKELKEDQLLSALGELESDSSFQNAEHKEEIF